MNNNNPLSELLAEFINPEVFAIKGKEAFIGGKIGNGNFHFAQLPFTGKPFDGAGFNALNLDDIFSTQAYLVHKPSNETLATLWFETYLASLKDGGSVCCAVADADGIVERFNTQFTTKTPI